MPQTGKRHNVAVLDVVDIGGNKSRFAAVHFNVQKRRADQN